MQNNSSFRPCVAFENPKNRSVEYFRPLDSFVLSLLFGPLYFVAKEIWNHAFFALCLAIMTSGISWFIYPFFTKRLLTNHYIRKGYRRLDNYNPRTGDKITNIVKAS